MTTSTSADAATFLKILAFGASLTEGFYNGGRDFHPYSIELEKCIDQFYCAQGIDREAMIHQLGMSGEYTSHMIPRLYGIINRSLSVPYKFVCILAGTNDLALTDSGEVIFERIKHMYNMVLDHGDGGTILVAITIPQSYFTDPSYIEKRDVINREIKKFCTEINTREGRVKAILVDFEALI